MKKIIIALSAITLLAACQKSLIDSEGLYENGIVAFQSNDSGEMAAFLETSGPVTFTIASSVKVDKDVTVNFEPVRDTAVLAAFNQAQGTNYWFLPESNVTLSRNSTVIKAGSAVSEPVTQRPVPGEEYAFLVIRGYVYASAANLPGGSYFEMPTTVSDPALSLEVCTMEIRVKANSWASANPFISSVIGVEENFLLRFGDISCDPNQLQLAGQGVSITSKAHFDTGKWYHIAVVADGIKQTCDLYINGELDSSTPMGGKGINLGKVYNSKLLSPTELVNGQCSIADPVKEARENKLLGYWKLDAENRGKDLTGNGYDGIAHGSVTYTEANIRCPE